MTEEGNAPIQDPMEFGEMANWTPLDGSEGLKRKRTETFEADFDYYYSVYDKTRGMEILDRLRTMNPETKSKALDWLIDNGFLHSEEVFNSAYINAMGDALYITSEEDDYDDYDAESFGAESRVCSECQIYGYWDDNPVCPMCRTKNAEQAEDATETFYLVTFMVQDGDTEYYPRIILSESAKNMSDEKLIIYEFGQAGDSGDDGLYWVGDTLVSIYDKQPIDSKAKEVFDEYGFSAESPSATIPVNEPTWVKPVATALGFALGFFGIHEIKKVL